MISQYLFTIAPLFLMYFIISFYVEEPNFWLLFPIIFDVILETIFQPVGLVLGNIQFYLKSHIVKLWVYQPVQFWVNVFYYISILWFVMYLSYLIIETDHGPKDSIFAEQQKIFITGIVIVFVISPLIYSMYVFIDQTYFKFLWIAVIGRSISILGLWVFIISYLKSSSKIDYFQPQPLISLHIYNLKHKEFVYQVRFKGEEDDTIINFLVSNFLDLNSMISEVIDKKVEIQQLDTTNSKIIIHEFRELQQIIILIVKYYTDALFHRFHTLIQEIDSSRNLITSEMLKLAIQRNFGV